MSFVRHRGVSGEPLGGLGFLEFGPLGRGSPAVRLPSVIPCNPSFVSGSHSTSQLFSHFHHGDSLASCSSRSPCEGGSRASPLGSRILQSPLCYPQGHRGLVTGNRSLPPQSFGSSLQFSHGDCCFGAPVSPSGGLDGVPRPAGRLPSGPGASVVAPLPAILCGVLGPPVSRSVLRPFVSPSGFHESHGPDICHHAPLRLPHYVVLGRLASPRLLVSGSCAGEKLSPLALSGARDSGESCLELLRPFPDIGLSGDESSNSYFEGFPDSKASSEALLSAARVRVLSAAASRIIATTSGGHVISALHNYRLSAPNAVSASTPLVVTFQPLRPSLGTTLASRIFSGGPSSLTSPTVFSWVFLLQI